MNKIDPVITSGVVHGRCPKCGEPFLGNFDCDCQEFEMKCVNCSYSNMYVYTWPDDLPKFKIRNKR